MGGANIAGPKRPHLRFRVFTLYSEWQVPGNLWITVSGASAPRVIRSQFAPVLRLACLHSGGESLAVDKTLGWAVALPCRQREEFRV